MVVQCANPAPEAAAQRELIHQQPQRFQTADKQRHHHRGAGNGHIVIELALRLAERPAVGADHQHVIERIHQRHPAGKQRRKNHNRPNRHPARGAGGGDPQHADFRRRIKAEAKQKAHQIHLPAAANQAEGFTEQPAHHAAAGHDLIAHLFALLPRPKAAPDAAQNDQVDKGHHQQKQRRHGGADNAAGLVKPAHLLAKRGGGRGNRRRSQHHNRRMPQREPRANGKRPLPLLHHFAGHVVDRRDMVGVHRVAQTITPGQQAGGHQRAAAAERRKRPAPGQQIGGNQCQHQRRCARLLTQNRHYHIGVL